MLSTPQSSASILNTPLKPRPLNSSAPLTATQLQWWIDVAERCSGKSERLLRLATRISGNLDPELLRDCLHALAQRHETLRTRILLTDGVPIQYVEQDPNHEWQILDLSDTPESAESTLAGLADAFVTQEVSLFSGPLLAARLFKLSEREHVLIIALEHMITDAISNTILHNELWTLYRQGTSGAPFSLPKLSVQYADYAVWQQETYDAWMNAHGSYWKSYLAGVQPARLPAEADAPDTLLPEYEKSEILLDLELTAKLREIARIEKTTLAMVVLVIYLAAAFQWCGTRSLLVGFASHTRYRAELVTMIGFISNLLFLRMTASATDTLLDLLVHANRELQSAYEHRDFDRVPQFIRGCVADLYFDWIPAPRATRLKPLERHSQSMVEELRLEPYPLRAPLPRPFCVIFSETAGGVSASVTYQRGLFRAETIGRFAHLFQTFARRFAAKSPIPAFSNFE